MSHSDLFLAAVEFLLAEEGGHVDDARDPGGETKFGISKRSFPNLDIGDLSRDDAIAIYHREFWIKLQGDRLLPAVAVSVFDTAVNMGVGTSIKLLQRSLDVADDGVLGRKTMARAATADATLIDEFLARRLKRYTELPTFAIYGLGWTRRVLRCHRFALSTHGETDVHQHR